MSNGLLDESDLGEVSSTYCILTAERLLEHFNIHLDNNELFKVTKDPKSVYHQLLVVPFKNLINGIILTQAYDYMVYAQKLFVDYYISGEGNEKEAETMSTLGEEMEHYRERMVQMSEFYENDAAVHRKLIAESQNALINLVHELSPVKDTEEVAERVKEVLRPFYNRSLDLNQVLRNYRVEFKEIIIEVIRILALVPDYHIDQQQDAKNREDLDFDDQIG